MRGSISRDVADDRAKLHLRQDVPVDVDPGRDLDQLHAVAAAAGTRSAR